MEKRIAITDKYLNIPVFTGTGKCLVSVWLEEGTERKVFEFLIPLPAEGEEKDKPDFMAQIPVSRYLGKTISVRGSFPAGTGEWIQVTGKRQQPSGPRPHIHFSADFGWTNDPNGMVFKDGVYHLYFQYNPFDICWENMSWGHAVSHDLLHWTQHDTVMLPDEDGVIFSGCGLVNDHASPELPRDAIVFFYTAAGGLSDWSSKKPFVQKIACSTDNGEILHKLPLPCIGAISKDSRDPKVFWHEETDAFIMVLWLKENDFGIFRSQDLINWETTQEITLEGGFECPDLFCLSSSDGKKKWFFWTADGYYFPGEFDGYRFTPDGVRKSAYLTPLPYAAQTFSGTGNRTISIPWLRMENDGRSFTSFYGIPTELSLICREGESFLAQRPVQELFDQLRPSAQPDADGSCCPLIISVKLPDQPQGPCRWEAGGSVMEYNPLTGILKADEKEYPAQPGSKELLLILDDRILEIFFDEGIISASIGLKERTGGFAIQAEEGTIVNYFTVD